MIESRKYYKTKGGEEAFISHVYPEGIMCVEGWIVVEGERKSCFWSKKGEYFSIPKHERNLILD